MLADPDVRDGSMERPFAIPACAEYMQDVHCPTYWSMETPIDLYQRQSLDQNFEADTDHWQLSTELFQQQLLSKNETSQVIPHGLPHSTPWPALEDFQNVEMMDSLPSASGAYPSLAPNVNMASSPSFRALAEIQHADFAVAQATVVPSQTFVEVDIDDASHIAVCPDSMNSSFASMGTTATGYSSDEIWSSDESPETMKEDADWIRVRSEPDYEVVSRMHETSTGAKGVKKGRKMQKGSHRKSKGKNEKAVFIRGKVDVEIEPDAYKAMQRRNKDGKISPNSADKKVCGLELTPGEFCDKAFNRPEHLTRHKRTHKEDRPYVCVILSCVDKKNNRRAFGRSDNRQAHYITHLKKRPGSRNSLVEPEELYRQIRRVETREEAEKTIKKLEKGRLEGKYEEETRGS